MALISCPECGKQISDKALACPNCGYPVQQMMNPQMMTKSKEEQIWDEVKEFLDYLKVKDREIPRNHSAIPTICDVIIDLNNSLTRIRESYSDIGQEEISKIEGKIAIGLVDFNITLYGRKSNRQTKVLNYLIKWELIDDDSMKKIVDTLLPLIKKSHRAGDITFSDYMNYTATLASIIKYAKNDIAEPIITYTEANNFTWAIQVEKEDASEDLNLILRGGGRGTPQAVNVPKCPTCGSTNISRISSTSTWLSAGLFGLGSRKIGKSFECKNCGYMW